MAGTDWEGEVLKRKETYEEGIERHNAGCDKNRENKDYTESRRLWGDFCRGKIKADELAERLGQLKMAGETEKIRELFNGKEI